MDWDTITNLFSYAKENMDKMCLEISLENWTLALNSSDQTIKCLEEILNSVYHCLSYALFNRAKAFLGSKKFFRSKRDCERILATSVSSRDLGIEHASATFDADVFTIFGQCLYGLSQIDIAKSAFRQALILDPHNLEAKQNLDKCVNLNVPTLPSLQKLPDELWIQIFAKLDVSSRVRSELVCKKWSALTPYSWYKVKLVPDDVWPSKSSSIPPPYFVGILKKCGRFTGESLVEASQALTEIRLHFTNSCPCVTDKALSKITDKLGPNLEHFKLFSDWDSFVGEKALCDFLDICSNLTTIKLGCLGQCHTEIMDLEALTSLSKFKNLTDFRLDVVNGLPWASLLPTYARQNGSTLKILALNAVHASELPSILELFPRLEQLCMWNSVDIKAATLVDLIQKFKDSKTNPIKLIASCYQVQMDQPLRAVLKKVPQFSVGCYYEHNPCDLA
uniref:F-box domain-containing protein n=1 Tax=Romanomermis culicivorax TaxID=13658 RepID=A0A915IYI8_ROMCU